MSTSPHHRRRLQEARPTAQPGERTYTSARRERAAARALNDALALAEEAGVPATGEELEGHRARRVVEFARSRRARMVVLGSRRRRLRPSIARRVIRKADRPVLVAPAAA